MFKPSEYNFSARIGNGLLAFINTFSGAVMHVNEYTMEKIETILKRPSSCRGAENEELLSLLVDNGYLVAENRDELLELKGIHETALRGEKAFGIGILPTLNCNFACVYCYEEQVAVDMTEEVQGGIVEYVKKNLPGREILYVDWFGGEPLLRLATIEKLGKIIQAVCENNQVKFVGSITTNGYLLNENNARILLGVAVKNVQITLDGPPRVHDKRRFLRSGKGTFEKIFKNIKETARLFDEFCIRVNIDERNQDAIPELIDILEPVKKNVALAFRPANPSNNDEKSRHFCLATAEYLKVEDDIIALAKSKGFRLLIGYTIPGTVFCSGYLTNAVMVDAYGDLHLCPYYLGHRDFRYAKLEPDGEFSGIGGPQAEWRKYKPFEDEACIPCPALPLCMGGCLLYLNADEKDERRCMLKHNFIERMALDVTLNKFSKTRSYHNDGKYRHNGLSRENR